MNEVLFFDDEFRNIRDTQNMVCGILVKNGVDSNVVRKGIETFLRTNQKGTNNE